LLYGYYRGIEKPEMSLILTIISLGTRVILAYLLAPVPSVGLNGIWWSIPAGWILADITGILYLRKSKILPEI
ncbi:MAG: MATE family efflux transporter, partial [Ruminococcus sp.]